MILNGWIRCPTDVAPVKSFGWFRTHEYGAHEQDWLTDTVAGGLMFFPALTLGPLGEQLAMSARTLS